MEKTIKTPDHLNNILENIFSFSGREVSNRAYAQESLEGGREMFWKKNKRSIIGFGDVAYDKDGFFKTSIEIFDKQYEIHLIFEDYPITGVFTAEQEAAVSEYFAKRRDIEDYIIKYYKDNCEDLIEEYYYASLNNWDSCCKSEEDYKMITGEVDTETYKRLIYYYEPQSLIFGRNGDCALMAFVAIYDDHGIAITIKPKFEVMTQDEYNDQYNDEY